MYTAKQGDTWDVVSLNNYGTDSFSAIIMDANPSYAGVLVFSGGEELEIPVLSGDSFASQTPPWGEEEEEDAD